MTATIKRRPGRPRGSSVYSKSDPALLEQVADKLFANPALKPRAAIVCVVGAKEAAALRRLQTKFARRSRAEWVNDAQQRRAAKQQEQARFTTPTSSTANRPRLTSDLINLLTMPNAFNDPLVRILRNLGSVSTPVLTPSLRAFLDMMRVPTASPALQSVLMMMRAPETSLVPTTSLSNTFVGLRLSDDTMKKLVCPMAPLPRSTPEK